MVNRHGALLGETPPTTIRQLGLACAVTRGQSAGFTALHSDRHRRHTGTRFESDSMGSISQLRSDGRGADAALF